MKTLGTLAVSAAVALFCNNALATYIAGECESCTTAQYNSMALAQAKAAGLHGNLIYTYVYDINFNHLMKYQVGGEPGAGGVWTYELTLVSDSPTDQSAWDTERSATEGNGGSSLWFPHIQSSTFSSFPYPGETAFNLAITPAEINAISDWALLQTTNISLNAGTLTTYALINAVGSLVLKTDAISIDLTITLDDSSSVELLYKAGTPKFTLKAAFDSHQNPIPIPPDKPTSHFIFPYGGGAGQFGSYMNSNFGTTLGNVPVCTNVVMACTTSGAGYNCVWMTCGGNP